MIVCCDCVAPGYIVTFLTILNIVLMIGSTAFSNWWLSYWLGKGNGVRTISLFLSLALSRCMMTVLHNSTNIIFVVETNRVINSLSDPDLH